MSTKQKAGKGDVVYGVAVELGSAKPRTKIVDMRTLREVKVGLVMEIGQKPFLYDKKAKRAVPLDEETHRTILNAARKEK
ncbi:MAG: hypothetical protein KGI00_04050 [Candidatus Micrarchaeota archaeon]|nr:hypothetical protein [Candidatus Micrarchaeota archaeon]MDE1824405.1 hypothetical protein [Candidatus Micrarchaeota archaeon]MDE1849872.1 hypothetical protein [Candidatus Micrarchaeota archaeon]